MNTPLKTLPWMVLCSALAGFVELRPAGAQEPTATPAPGAAATQSSHTAQAEAGEPRAATSPASAAAKSAGPATPAKAAPAAPAAAASAAVPSAGPASRTQPASGGASRDRKIPATDRLDLGTATVTGDREQPKVMYIVPWKKSDIGDLSGKPMNSLLDEALAPVDRDEFKREVAYYQAVKADASQNGASRPPAQQVEK